MKEPLIFRDGQANLRVVTDTFLPRTPGVAQSAIRSFLSVVSASNTPTSFEISLASKIRKLL